MIYSQDFKSRPVYDHPSIIFAGFFLSSQHIQPKTMPLQPRFSQYFQRMGSKASQLWFPTFLSWTQAMVYHKWYVPDFLLIKQIFRNVSISCCFLFMGASYQDTWSVGSLRTVPTIVIAHTFCASPDTWISYRQCLINSGIFLRGLKLSGECRS